jgi:hypothetical protein
MQNPFNNPFFPTMKRVAQKTSSHCGPAVLEMLLSFVGVYADQDEFVNAIGIGPKLKEYGMVVPEMASAVKILAPQLSFWYKTDSTLSDLSNLVNNFNFPTAVEWQGVFYEDEDDDNGHYSVITHISTANNIVVLSDPYTRFAGTDRRFSIMEFEQRWWDESEIKDNLTGRTQIMRDNHMMFIVTPKDASFPDLLGMTRG